MDISISGLLTVSNNQLFVHYQKQFNSRPTLVFLHDSLGSTQLWRDFPNKLAQAAQCNILVYDRLGYGQSEAMPTHERPVSYMEAEAATLNNLLQELDIDNAILFGHSDGGSIALIAAAKYPERIKALICEAAHIFVEEVTLAGIRQAMAAYDNTDLKQRLEKYHGNNTDILFKAWTLTWTRDDFRNWNIEHFLPSITCPLLFIQGEADEYGTLQQVNQTVSSVSGPAAKHIIPDVGHTPHKESPDATLQVAQHFIEGLNTL